MRIALVLAAVVLCAAAARPAVHEAAPSDSGLMRYGFIRSNVTCSTKPRPKRARLVTQVFQYCPLEVPSRQIIEDNKVFFAQVAQTTCQSDYEVTYESVVSDASEERIQRDHKEAMTESGYDEYQDWHASVEYPTRRCR